MLYFTIIMEDFRFSFHAYSKIEIMFIQIKESVIFLLETKRK